MNKNKKIFHGILHFRIAYATMSIEKGHLLVTDTLWELPIDGSPDYSVTAIAASFAWVDGYFCVLLLSLLPIVYPKLKQVIHKLITAMKLKKSNILSN